MQYNFAKHLRTLGDDLLLPRTRNAHKFLGLMLQATRRIQPHRILWHPYSTHTLDETQARVIIPRVSIAQNTIYVRAWDYPKDLTEAFAILRGVERKYGKIREFKWMRDAEEQGLYQNVLWAAFWESGSLENVPRSGEMLYIPKPVRGRGGGEGGIGFTELGDLILSTERVVQPESDVNAMGKAVQLNNSNENTLTIKVERARTSIFASLPSLLPYPPFSVSDKIFNPNPSSVPPQSPSKRAAIAHALLDWGGFAPLSPIFKDGKSPYNVDLEDEGREVDREKLRKVLNKAATFVGRPDPSFAVPPPPPPTETAAAAEVEVVSQSDGVPEAEGPNLELERAVNDSRLAPTQNRSWFLPSPPLDVPSATATPTTKKNNITPTNTESAARNTKQEKILAKAKAATRAVHAPKVQVKAATFTSPTIIKPKPIQIAFAKGSMSREKQVEESARKSAGPTSSASKTSGAEKEKGLRNRFWEVAGKWL